MRCKVSWQMMISGGGLESKFQTKVIALFVQAAF